MLHPTSSLNCNGPFQVNRPGVRATLKRGRMDLCLLEGGPISRRFEVSDVVNLSKSRATQAILVERMFMVSLPSKILRARHRALFLINDLRARSAGIARNIRSLACLSHMPNATIKSSCASSSSSYRYIAQRPEHRSSELFVDIDHSPLRHDHSNIQEKL